MALTSAKNLKNHTKSGQKSTRGRKAFITPEKIDLTGKNHIMIVRRVQNSSNKNKKKNTNSCINCDANYQYADLLSQHIDKIESLVNNLKVISKRQKPKESFINNLDNLDFTKMDTDTLIKCSALFNNHSPQLPQSSAQPFNLVSSEEQNLEQTLQINDNSGYDSYCF